MSTQVEMIFWDVQHGHATYIKTPNDRHIVVDLGTGAYSGSSSFSPLKHLREKYHIEQLDLVIITHPHKDHIDDIMEFDAMSPKILYRPIELTNDEVMKGVKAEDWKKFEKYCEINDRYNVPIEKDSYDNTSNPANWGGLSINSFLSPQCPHDNFNNHSIVTVFEYANTKVIVPGDNENASFVELLKNEDFVSAITDCDVLLAPHHGRESGYNSDFIKYANPRITIVSDGKHCDSSANDRYSKISRGWTVHKRGDESSKTRYCLTTNSDGTITVQFGLTKEKRYLEISIP